MRPLREAVPWLKRILALGLILFPALQALWFVYRFGVDVPHWDEWGYVSLAWNTPSLRQLWAQHNEHRIPVGKLLVLLVERASDCDVRAGMYASWIFLVALVLLLGRARRGSWLAFAPVAWVVFTLRQHENLLWGTQCLMTFSALLSVAAFALLDGPTPRITGAILCAAGASLSFANGLVVWPVGALQMVAARRSRARIAAWVMGGAGLTAAYLYDWVRPSYHPAPVGLTRAGDAFAYLVAWLGSPLSGDIPTALGVGAALLCTCALAVREGVRSASITPERLMPAALIAFTLACGALLAVGRGGFGVGQALQSRYVVFSLLGIAGAWLIVAANARGFVAGALLSLVIAGSLASRIEAIEDARTDEHRRIRWQHALLSYRLQPDDALRPLFPDVDRLRQLAPEMERRRLGPFRRAIDPATLSPGAGEAATIVLDPLPGSLHLSGDLEVSGVASFGDRPAAGVVLHVDSSLDVPTVYSVRRRGARFGFYAALAARSLGAGRHSLEVRAIAPGGKAYAAPLAPMQIVVR